MDGQNLDAKVQALELTLASQNLASNGILETLQKENFVLLQRKTELEATSGILRTELSQKDAL